MAEIDRQAALAEFDKASHLKAKAEQLFDIAAELQEEAERHEREGLDLIAPDKVSAAPSRRRS